MNGQGGAFQLDVGTLPEPSLALLNAAREGALANVVINLDDLRERSADIADLGLAAGQAVTLTLGLQSRTCALVAAPDLPIGVARTPVGLPGVPTLTLPAWGSIERGPGP